MADLQLNSNHYFFVLMCLDNLATVMKNCSKYQRVGNILLSFVIRLPL